MGGDSRIGKCCCGGLPSGTRLAIWDYGTGHAGYAFLVGEEYPWSWATSLSNLSATYKGAAAASFSDGYPGGWPDGTIVVTGTYPASTSAVTITGDLARIVRGVWNVISGKTATSNTPVSGTGIMLCRLVLSTPNIEILTTGDAIAFTDDYINGFTPRIVAYGDTDEWLPRPSSGHWRVYKYVDYTYFDADAGQVDPWYPGVTIYQEFDSQSAAEAYLATL